MTEFFNSNFFQTCIILVVGLFVFIQYKLHVRDEKRNAACMILMEIRNIECNIENLKKHGELYNVDTIYKSNSWEKYKYLFVKILDSDEFELVGDLYSNARRIEDERLILCNQKRISEDEKAKALQWQIVREASRIVTSSAVSSEGPKDFENKLGEFKSNIMEITKLICTETPGYIANSPHSIIVSLLQLHKPVITSSAAEKMKNIAGK